MIAKAEHAAKGFNPRFIVTNIVSAHRWWANPWRLLLSGLAYTLLQGLRRLALAGTALARATCATLRVKRVKIGPVIMRSVTRVRLHLSSYHPGRDIFVHAHGALAPPR